MGIEISSEFSPEKLKDKRMERAVAVCAELFLERGIENVKMTDIADLSGVGVATLYRYFGTKTGIAIEAMTFLWYDLRNLFGGLFDSEAFLAQSGLKQLQDLLRMFVVLFTAHKGFVRLLGEFDRFIIHENVPSEDLHDYEASIIDFYPIVERAYRQGISDGTMHAIADFGLFYMTYAHALTEMCKKFIDGEILPSDDFSDAENELGMLIDCAVSYLKA